MHDFVQQRFNILLCSTIIETGIDIPTANTIIMHRADKFGLAQLHQLRGRVGRSHHQAYAYLLTPDEEALSTTAKKRLEAIQMMEELGSGFFLAMHDLEIRGAGEVLGDQQSGEMQEVGFNLYCAMLDTAVKSLKLGREPDLNAPLGVTTEINLHVPALLPADYCSDVHERLALYKRLADAERDGDRVYAFGHPMYNLGPTAFPMTRAYVYTVLPSLFSSSKLSTTGEVIGTFLQDRATAIAGRLGPGPSLIPVSVSLQAARGATHTFRFEVVRIGEEIGPHACVFCLPAACRVA